MYLGADTKRMLNAKPPKQLRERLKKENLFIISLSNIIILPSSIAPNFPQLF